MAHVIVEVNGRPYTMQCPDGEEDHLRELAKLLDSEVIRIRQSVGTVGDIRLLVMSGLMVADRLSEAIRRIEALEGEVQDVKQLRDQARSETHDIETRATSRLDAVTQRLQLLARAMGG
ncbi:MAG: cell division protein ZapA [Rhizobiales bacterium]|nr:cell division protein ZapA [Hyphomicrobiales bacterium]MBI3672134.1 cell division protein ZapA [Hyphomicrobiales bacterium]